MTPPTSTRTGPRQRIAIAVLLILAVVAGTAIMRMQPARSADPHGHGDEPGHEGEHGHADAGAVKGPHGGQLMTDGDFSVEVRLVEDGGAPNLKIWLSDKGKPLPPSAAKVTVTVTRPDGQEQELSFQEEGDALTSEQSIPEPHVFEAVIAAQTAKEPYLFTYSLQEGRVNMTEAQVKAAGISIEAAGAAPIRSVLQLPGEIRFNEDRTARLTPRVAGVVQGVPVNPGQQVRKGQVLAVVSSPMLSDQRSELQVAKRRLETARATYERERLLHEEKITARQDLLQAQAALTEAEIAVASAGQKLQALGANSGSASVYELRAPFDGMIVEKKIAVAEAVKDDTPALTLSDLSTVWATVSVPSQELHQVRVGRDVAVRSTSSSETVQGRVAYVSALIGEQTRTAQARIVMPNPGLVWRPGLFVTVDVTTAQADAPVTVAAQAVQRLEGKPAVFLKVPGGFIAQPVQVGRTDGQRVEIVKGLVAGSQVATQGSFVVKAEHGKSQAGHGH